MTQMRAKLKVTNVQKFGDAQENLTFSAVGKPTYAGDPAGLDEDNTYAKFTPNAQLSMTVLNPELIGKFELGDTFYVDFTPVPKPEQKAE